MKLLHLADMHIGKRVNGFSMLDDQKYILNQIIQIAAEQKPDGIIIAGDVYDRPVPSEPAVQLFDSFLVSISKLGIPVFIISGNHDSAERIAFGSEIMNSRGVYISPVYSGDIQPVMLSDEYGAAAVWLIPFVKPAHVKRYFPDKDIVSYADAMQAVISSIDMDSSIRNIAVVHQFITGGSTCDSEIHCVGGTEEIPAYIFNLFDYVALGHLHGAQQILRPTMRYCGSPLKYSFSEYRQKKSIAMIDLCGKGDCSVSHIPLHAKRDMLRLKDSFDSLVQKNTVCDDYCEITLTDEQDVPNALSRLRAFYPNIMQLKYDNTRTRAQYSDFSDAQAESKTPLELFDELYKKQNGQSMDSEQYEFIRSLIDEIWEENE